MCANSKDDLLFLYQSILKLNTVEECEKFFKDLCTYTEIDSMAQRVKVAKMLIDEKTYEDIIEKTQVSSATLSRVNKCVKYGEGYKLILKN